MKKTGKKCIGHFTTDARKAFKLTDKLVCRVDGDGFVYVTDGFAAYRMTPAEYAAIIQPVACCEAGNWTIRDGRKVQDSFDLVGLFNSMVENIKNTAPVDSYPFKYQIDEKDISVFYAQDRGFAALYNSRYVSALAPGFTLYAPGPLGGAVAYQCGDPCALILPIRCKDEIQPKIFRSVRAYFIPPEADSEQLAGYKYKADKLQKQLDEARETIARQADEIESLRTEAADPTNETPASDNETTAPDNETPASDNENPTPTNETPDGSDRFAELYKSAWCALSNRHDEIPHFAEIAASFDRISSTDQGRALLDAFRATRTFRTVGDDLVAARNRAAFVIALAQYNKELAA